MSVSRVAGWSFAAAVATACLAGLLPGGTTAGAATNAERIGRGMSDDHGFAPTRNAVGWLPRVDLGPWAVAADAKPVSNQQKDDEMRVVYPLLYDKDTNGNVTIPGKKRQFPIVLKIPKNWDQTKLEVVLTHAEGKVVTKGPLGKPKKRDVRPGDDKKPHVYWGEMVEKPAVGRYTVVINYDKVKMAKFDIHAKDSKKPLPKDKKERTTSDDTYFIYPENIEQSDAIPDHVLESSEKSSFTPCGIASAFPTVKFDMRVSESTEYWDSFNFFFTEFVSLGTDPGPGPESMPNKLYDLTVYIQDGPPLDTVRVKIPRE